MRTQHRRLSPRSTVRSLGGERSPSTKRVLVKGAAAAVIVVAAAEVAVTAVAAEAVAVVAADAIVATNPFSV